MKRPTLSTLALSAVSLVAGCGTSTPSGETPATDGDQAPRAQDVSAPAKVEEHIAVGQWVTFEGTTSAQETSPGQGTSSAPMTSDISMKFAIVGQEDDADGNPSVWLEMETTQSNRLPKQVVQKLLVPISSFQDGALPYISMTNSPVRNATRCIMKFGDQPAWELSGPEAMNQMRGQLGATRSSDEKVTELGDEVLETPKGQMACTKKQYHGTTSQKLPALPEGEVPEGATVQLTYDDTVWHTSDVPIVGYTKAESTLTIEFAGIEPVSGTDAAPTSNLQTQFELVDFGEGAKSVITEEPVPGPPPMTPPGMSPAVQPTDE